VPRDFLGLSHVANWEGNVGDEHVQLILHLWGQCQQPPLCIFDAHDAGVDVDLLAKLIELPDTEDAVLEPSDVVDPGEGAVFTTLAVEDDCPTPINAHHPPISKMNHAADTSVELGEGSTGTSQVNGGPGVDDPFD
jgi:hypothetical protein